MLLSEVEDQETPRPTSRREFRAAESRLASAPTTAGAVAAPPVSRAVSKAATVRVPWHAQRPLVGGILLAVGGVAIFFSGSFDFGQFRVQLGTDALQTAIVPALLVLLGVLAVSVPRMHAVIGIVALATSLYSLVAVNLGGFFVGMIIASVGGILVVAWMRPETRSDQGRRARPEDSRNGRKP